jgi:hypothetical protein
MWPTIVATKKISAEESKSPERVSGSELRQEIEKQTESYIQRLEKRRGAKLTVSERSRIINRLWNKTKAELEKSGSYVVFDP